MSEAEEHGDGSSVRAVEISRLTGNSCGFHLTRSKWDPYPWIRNVDVDSAAELAGVRPGDCILEVNGEDVLGLRIGEIAELVRARPDQVSLLLWNAGTDPHCAPESLCCGPMPLNMQRLSTCLASILTVMECPICLDTIVPPACQCTNGHLVCARCHAKSERCSVCRIRLSRGRSLFADQVYNSLTDAFELSNEINGKTNARKIHEIFRLRLWNKNKMPEIKITQSHTNKFLAKFASKSSSAENLSNQFLAPKTFLPDEFNSNLKVKSLSTSEIFRPNTGAGASAGTGIISRTCTRGHNKNDLNSRTISCRRSYDSLDGNISDSNLIESKDDLLYYCPFSIECCNRVKGDALIQHFQHIHDGPLIQYFKSKITFDLLNHHNNTYCILHNTGKYFFLKINSSNEKKINKENNLHDIVIWMWFLGDQNNAKKYQMHIYLYYSTSREKQLLSLNSAIYSLNKMSWHDMKNSQNGVFISGETLTALNSNSCNIILDVEIKYNNV